MESQNRNAIWVVLIICVTIVLVAALCACMGISMALFSTG